MPELYRKDCSLASSLITVKTGWYFKKINVNGWLDFCKNSTVIYKALLIFYWFHSSVLWKLKLFVLVAFISFLPVYSFKVTVFGCLFWYMCHVICVQYALAALWFDCTHFSDVIVIITWYYFQFLILAILWQSLH